ncbi:hypothetical protein C7M84_014398 [Penaeus vannamei]|uniref:Uncharacterized protein n=1 Tax=Penaeus vannamei TaxID=6689 RepID=A0A423STK9_PENVA|nr:hypothetical protein C7M84_014398 [Penaeus vannamei]
MLTVTITARSQFSYIFSLSCTIHPQSSIFTTSTSRPRTILPQSLTITHINLLYPAPYSHNPSPSPTSTIKSPHGPYSHNPSTITAHANTHTIPHQISHIETLLYSAPYSSSPQKIASSIHPHQPPLPAHHTAHNFLLTNSRHIKLPLPPHHTAHNPHPSSRHITIKSPATVRKQSPSDSPSRAVAGRSTGSSWTKLRSNPEAPPPPSLVCPLPLVICPVVSAPPAFLPSLPWPLPFFLVPCPSCPPAPPAPCPFFLGPLPSSLTWPLPLLSCPSVPPVPCPSCPPALPAPCPLPSLPWPLPPLPFLPWPPCRLLAPLPSLPAPAPLAPPALSFPCPCPSFPLPSPSWPLPPCPPDCPLSPLSTSPCCRPCPLFRFDPACPPPCPSLFFFFRLGRLPPPVPCPPTALSPPAPCCLFLVTCPLSPARLLPTTTTNLSESLIELVVHEPGSPSPSCDLAPS